MITVGDLKAYLAGFPENMEVELDKNDWGENETGIENPTPHDIIERSGLFWRGSECLVINN